jgi:hypothetical protein
VISLLSQQFYKAHQAAEWWFYACIEKILWRHICQRLFLHFAALSTDRFQPSWNQQKMKGLELHSASPRCLTRSREATKKRSKIMDGKIIGRRVRLGQCSFPLCASAPP